MRWCWNAVLKIRNAMATYGYAFFLLSRRGPSALEVESDLREYPPGRAVVHFFMPGMPANFNKLGSELLGWLTHACHCE